MVYEYCDEIKNSGINMNAFPASCGSYMEMGLYVAESTIREFNAIFKEAGLVELEKFKNNTITEASEQNMFKTVVGKIKKALIAAFNGIKAAWKKILDAINNKIDNYYKKLGDRFEKIDDILKYKDAIEDRLKKINIDYTTLALDEANKLDAELAKAYDKLKDEIENDNQDTNYSIFKMYGLLINKIDSSASINGADDAKKFIRNYIYATKNDAITAEWINNNKSDIINIIKVKSKSKVNSLYKEAKRACDAALKKLDKLDNDSTVKEDSKAIVNLDLAYQTLLLELGSYVKSALNTAIEICNACVMASQTKIKESANIDTKVKYDVDFVNKAFE